MKILEWEAMRGLLFLRAFPAFLLMASAAPAWAGTQDLEQAVKRIPGHMLKGSKEGVKGKRGLALLASGAIAEALTTLDDEIQREIGRARPLGGLKETGNFLGSPEVVYGATGFWFLASHLSPSSKGRETGEIALEAVSVTGIAVAVLKRAVGRERPDGSDRLSFPSLHSANSFALATVAAGRYGRKIGIPAYLGAAFIALSRQEKQKHFTSDTFFGAALGTLAARSFLKIHEKSKTSRLDFLIFPSYQAGRPGLAVQLNF